ncbi:hypothetical protein HPDFL43_12963 [Hoeflea phototrophica DFL-43]|jgi:uncharacterized protein YjiS (DUF1127 family)|uniref:Aminoglycoside phosphotransferase n=1 Tax=Hoeflea phototrophica (strain DSM 17068 / NCIMB 14078 / DFL-43) TaxID=411684 RepID=A9DC93_HOEPD|nr:hypothetical protein [Hoeflea phototrophica]EDQ32380.1 hypothetical protein HPDFL43_12963 [Hoeflea phototrophica DFL-43]
MSTKFFQNALDRLVSARERQARRYINGAMLSMDDAQLKELGRTREELKREGAQTYIF